MSFHIGQRLSYANERCTIRYVGEVAKTTGQWLGVEWDDPSRGKHSGEHNGVRYFECRNNHPTAGSFVRPNRPHDKAISVVEAVRQKYAANMSAIPATSIRISGKEVEEVGFEKIQKQISELKGLRIVVLDGLCISGRISENSDASGEADLAAICPNIRELDLSRSLFEDMNEVMTLIGGLEHLESLKIDGNRFSNFTSMNTRMMSVPPYSQLACVSLDDTLIRWKEVEEVCFNLPTLSSLSLGGNQLESTSPPPLMPTTIKQLNLERNRFESLADISMLAASLPNLERLILKHNNISSTKSGQAQNVNTFSRALVELDLASNNVNQWSLVNDLTTMFPGLKSLRLAHNPLYSSEDAFILTVARLGQLVTLNYSTITEKERLNAETFYLSQIARELSPAAASARKDILQRHPRYDALCKIYGEPTIDDRIARKDTLAAGLALCNFLVSDAVRQKTLAPKKVADTVELELPKSFTIYTVQSMIGKVIRFERPMQLKLFLNEDSTELTPKTRMLETWVDENEATIRVELST